MDLVTENEDQPKDDESVLSKDSKGNVVITKLETDAEAAERLKKELAKLEAELLQMEADSNLSWERKRKEKIAEKEKRFIPDKQWSIIVGVLGSLLLIGLIQITLSLISIMLGAEEEEEAPVFVEEPAPYTTTGSAAAP